MFVLPPQSRDMSFHLLVLSSPTSVSLYDSTSLGQDSSHTSIMPDLGLDHSSLEIDFTLLHSFEVGLPHSDDSSLCRY